MPHIDEAQAGLLAPDRIAAELRDDIVRGRLLPGSRLKDAELAERFGVSRNTLRDAVRTLVSDGLVVTRVNAGSSVRVLTEDDARDIYGVRRALETSAIEASSRVPAARFEAIEDALDGARRAVDEERWRDLGTASLGFHRAIVGLHGSPRLDAFFTNILAQLRLVFSVMPDESSFQLQWIDLDREIADHIVSGRRREASSALLAYLDRSESLIIDTIRAARSSRRAH